MRISMRAIFWAVTIAFICVVQNSKSIAQEYLLQRYDPFVQHGKPSFLEKRIKELNTKEGRAAVNALASYIGIDPVKIDAGIARTADILIPPDQEDIGGLIRTPEGYTICYAKPAMDDIGAGQRGIETYGDTIFNTSLVRVIPDRNNDDGLVWNLVVPFEAITDARVTGVFDVVFVKADPGWRQHHRECRPSGEHPWLARNNYTSLNVPCSVPQYCE
jgi:hypothetical protein